jgi:hypothetical protein
MLLGTRALPAPVLHPHPVYVLTPSYAQQLSGQVDGLGGWPMG